MTKDKCKKHQLDDLTTMDVDTLSKRPKTRAPDTSASEWTELFIHQVEEKGLFVFTLWNLSLADFGGTYARIGHLQVTSNGKLNK